MRISIAERLRPFSHQPGTYCLLPGSALRVQLFPALIRVCDLSEFQPQQVAEIEWGVKGPVKNFTATLDLEKGGILVEGQTQTGFMRYKVHVAVENQAVITLLKTPSEGLFCSQMGKAMHTGEQILLRDDFPFLSGEPKERLSLGCHKLQDWDLILRRLSLLEIFPFWYRLGSWIPSSPLIAKEGTLYLLQESQEIIESRDLTAIVPSFQKLLLAGFDSILAPRLEDVQHQGIPVPCLSSQFKGTPLSLLSEGKTLIRNIFFKEERDRLNFLPALPPEFHCGRFLGIQSKIGMIDMEWSKKTIRRLILYAQQDGQASFQFQKHLRSFRLRDSLQHQGQRLLCGEPFSILSGQRYFLDNFQK